MDFDFGEDPRAGQLPPVGVTAKAPKRPKISDLELARGIVENWPNHLAFEAGQAYELVYRDGQFEGWVECSAQVRGACNAAKGTWADSLWKIIEAHCQIPNPFALDNPPVFWVKSEPNKWDFRWRPFEISLDEIAFADYVYDIKTGDTRQLSNSVVWGPLISLPLAQIQESDPCEEFEYVLRNAFKDRKQRVVFQDLMSQILQPHRLCRMQLVLYGIPHSGKTTLATAICCAPSGQRGCNTSQESELVRDKWATTLLLNKFANLSDDSATSSKWVAFLKKYTSGRMQCEPKGKQPFAAVPTAKLISTCNDLPDLMDATGAAGDRFFPFEFTDRIPVSGDINQSQMMNPAFWSKPERRLGVLQWLFEGLERFVKRGKFQYTPEFESTRTKLRAESDPVEYELKNLLRANPSGFVPTSNILAQFRMMNAVKLANYMHRLFPTASPGRDTVGGQGQVRGWKGVEYVE